MNAVANTTAEAATTRPLRGRRRWPRVTEIVLMVIAVFCLAAFLLQDFGAVLRLLYSPLAVLLLVVVFVEYLVVKSGDRSRLYRIEIDKMREREQEHVTRIRCALEEVDRALERARDLPAPGGDPAATEATANDVKEGLRRVAGLLRPDLR